jgi:hypothetical protein
VIHGQQADFGAGERERVDPGELVADEALATRVGAVVESLGGGEQQVQFTHCRLQLVGGDELREDHEAMSMPAPRRLFQVHRTRITEARAAGKHFSLIPHGPVRRPSWPVDDGQMTDPLRET